MFGLSISHLLILLVIVLLLFGAKRLPELGSALGEGLRAFKKGLDGRDEGQPMVGHQPREPFQDPKQEQGTGKTHPSSQASKAPTGHGGKNDDDGHTS